MKDHRRFVRMLILGATAILLIVPVAQRLTSITFFDSASEIYLRIATFGFVAMSAWILFGDTARWPREEKRVQQWPNKVAVSGPNFPMLFLGVASVAVGIFVVFFADDFLKRSIDPQLEVCLVALLLCGGGALALLAIVRPDLVSFRFSNSKREKTEDE